jgi:hypothetical protein
VKEDEYNKLYLSFKRTGSFDTSLIREFLAEKGEKFNLDEFLQILQIMNHPFQSMQYDFSKYQGIDFNKIMVDTIIKHYDSKFGIQRYDINFSQIKDKRLHKDLIQKYPNGVIYI